MTTQDWTKLSTEELRRAVQRICNTSRSDDEIRRRVKDELNYPHRIALHTTEHKRQLPEPYDSLMNCTDRQTMFMMHTHECIVSG